ncbi:MAG: hypothetical protein ACM3PF_13820, partial [Bacteroidota bacterium]
LALALVALALATPPRIAAAAFDLRHATPEALGSASPDLASDPLGDRSSDAPRFAGAWSHASLDDVEGLAADDVAAAWTGRRVAIGAAWSRAGTPDLAEEAAMLEAGERGARVLLLRGRAERLALRFAGEPERSGWAGSAGVAARLAGRATRVEIEIEGDRALRSAGARALGAVPAVVCVLRFRAPALTLALADRWESDGRRSPRVALLFPVGSALSLRAARGSDPGRIGFALEARLGRIVVAAGRLDAAEGTSIASVGLRLASRGSGSTPGAPSPAPRAPSPAPGDPARARNPAPGARCWPCPALL